MAADPEPSDPRVESVITSPQHLTQPHLLRSYSDDSVIHDEDRFISHDISIDKHYNFFDSLLSDNNEMFIRDAIIYYTELSSNNKILYQPTTLSIKKSEYIEDLFDCIETHITTQRSNSLILHNIIQDIFVRYKHLIIDQLNKVKKPFIEIDEFKKYVDFVFTFIGQQYNEDVCSFTSNGNLDNEFVIYTIIGCILYFKFILENGVSENGEIKVILPTTKIISEVDIQHILDLVNAERKKLDLTGGKKIKRVAQKNKRKSRQRLRNYNNKTKKCKKIKKQKHKPKLKHTMKTKTHGKYNRNKSRKVKLQKRKQ